MLLCKSGFHHILHHLSGHVLSRTSSHNIKVNEKWNGLLLMPGDFFEQGVWFISFMIPSKVCAYYVNIYLRHHLGSAYYSYFYFNKILFPYTKHDKIALS